jgi:serine/threonine-protein kinase
MAPEQAKGEGDVDARVDIWSVGAMLFEMLTGRAAHAASTPVAVLARILTEPAPPPSSRRAAIPPALDAVVRRALSIDRAARFPTAREMIEALRAVRVSLETADTVPVFAPPPPSPVAVLVGDERDAKVGVSTSTAASSPQTSRERRSAEPPMDAAVTNDESETGKRSRAKPVLAGATVVLALGAMTAAAWMSTKDAPKSNPSTPEAVVVAPAISNVPAAIASLPSASTPPPPATVSAAPPAATAVSAPAANPDASTVAQPARDAGGATSRTACAPGEILSSGHCCPHGLVWSEARRCERPLATSF